MHTVQSAVRNCGRKAILALFLLSMVLLHPGAAFAASLQVSVRQINPAGTPVQTICTMAQKCSLKLPINSGQTTLTINIQYVANMIFSFQGSDGYYYTAPTGSQTGTYYVYWPQGVPPGTSTSGVTLFLPAVQHPESAPMLDIAQQAANNVSHAPVADLEITATSIP